MQNSQISMLMLKHYQACHRIWRKSKIVCLQQTFARRTAWLITNPQTRLKRVSKNSLTTGCTLSEKTVETYKRCMTPWCTKMTLSITKMMSAMTKMSAHSHSGITPMIKMYHKMSSMALKILNPGQTGPLTNIKTATTDIPTQVMLLKIRLSSTKVRICNQVKHMVTRATYWNTQYQYV